MSWKGGNTRAVIQDLFGIHTHTVMLAATGMHVGKTTLSLGVFRGLQSKWGHGRVAYCKPLGLMPASRHWMKCANCGIDASEHEKREPPSRSMLASWDGPA